VCHARVAVAHGAVLGFQALAWASILRGCLAMDGRRNLLMANMLFGACAHGAAHHPGDERLAKLDFEGNKRLSDKTLLTGLALHRVQKRGGTPDPYLVQVDADRIRGEYLRKGYLDVDVRPRVERKGDDATVIYTIEEGVRAVTRTVITGLPSDVSVAKVRAQLPLQEGKPFDYEPYDLAKPELLGVVQDAGYAHAQLDASVVADRASHTAIIELAYTPGPKCSFGPVEVTGVTGELSRAVRERVTFTSGQPYSTQAILETQRNLYGLGRFSTVQVQPDRSAGEVVGVQIAVTEAARHEVTLGGGLGVDPTSFEVRGRAGYVIAGWPFPLDTATVDLRPAYAVLRDGSSYEPRIRALGKLERRDLFWTYTKTSVEAGYNYLPVEAYTSYGPLARLGFETPLGTPRVLLRVGWGFENNDFRNINPLIARAPVTPPLPEQLRINHTERIGTYQQGLVVDLRDHPIEPTLGAYGDLRIGEGTKYAGGAYDYVLVLPDLRGYVPLVAGAVLAAHARFGAIYGDVPATERFFAGGAISQRGFSERRLAPTRSGYVKVTDKDEDKLCHPDIEMPGCEFHVVPYGGAGMIDTSLEARLPITTVKQMPLGAVVFLDGGDVTETPGELDPTHLHWALGAGLRLMTIVGPVRLDVGYRLNRVGTSRTDPDPGSHYAYHLTIGEAF
jgi:outer membrane protein assembly factor BamA